MKNLFFCSFIFCCTLSQANQLTSSKCDNWKKWIREKFGENTLCCERKEADDQRSDVFVLSDSYYSDPITNDEYWKFAQIVYNNSTSRYSTKKRTIQKGRSEFNSCKIPKPSSGYTHRAVQVHLSEGVHYLRKYLNVTKVDIIAPFYDKNAKFLSAGTTEKPRSGYFCRCM